MRKGTTISWRTIKAETIKSTIDANEAKNFLTDYIQVNFQNHFFRRSDGNKRTFYYRLGDDTLFN